MILVLTLASLILVGDKHDHHKEHKHRPPYNHEWVERQRIRENQEMVIQKLRELREGQRPRWRDGDKGKNDGRHE